MKNNYWDGTPNPGPTDFQCINRYKDHAISISVHVRYQCFLYAVIWENYHQSSKKSLLKKIDVQMAPIHLFLVILIVFIMLCTSWKIRNDTLFKMWDFRSCLSFRDGKWLLAQKSHKEWSYTAFAVTFNPQVSNKSH